MGAGVRPPFNPFPTTGEDEYNQPSSRSIAPILNFQRGGLADRAFGFKQRFIVVKDNNYNLVVSATAQAITSLNADVNNQPGFIDLGKLIGVRSPFILIPDIYSIIITMTNSNNPSDLSLSGWSVSLLDHIEQKSLFAASPSNPNSAFALLGFELQLPLLQYDDFAPFRPYLNFLENVYLVSSGALFNNGTVNKTINIRQTLIYRMEQIPA